MSVVDRFRLDGRVAVVTGASKNVGRAISQTFAEAGATVFMVARGAESLEDAAATVADATGADVRTITADVGTPEGAARIVDTVHAAFSQAHVLVNNAMALGERMPTFEGSDEGWAESLATNLLGPLRLCRGFGQRMFDGDGGSVINLLSGAAFVPVAGLVQYGAAKSALWTMTQYLSSEYATRVRFNALVPGTTVDPDTAGEWSTVSSISPSVVSLVPMGRVGHPMEVAPAALYLASEASSYTTGAMITVNGGRPQ